VNIEIVSRVIKCVELDMWQYCGNGEVHTICLMIGDPFAIGNKIKMSVRD